MEAVAVKFADAVAALGLSYTVTFVPFSVSRNAKSNPKSTDLQINWRVSVGKGGAVIATDYSQGIGHLPGFRWSYSMSLDEFKSISSACELGWYRKAGQLAAPKLVPPTLAEVMEALILDASAIDYANFEEWAKDMDYDLDSRKGEAIYKACLETGLRLRSMVGDTALGQLREAAQEL